MKVTSRLDTRPGNRKDVFIPMEQTPSSPQPDPVFRGHIPAYAAPDRAAWTRTHPAPYALEVEPKFVSRARAAIEKDAATLAFADAVQAHAHLDTIHFQVAYLFVLPEGTEVFFDPTDNQFWAYPA